MDPTNVDDEEPGLLCANCVASNPPRADFCRRCGAPLSHMATVDPLKSALSEGFAYRQAVDGPPRPIVLAGVWLLFGPGLIVLPAAAWADGSSSWSPAQWLPLALSFTLSAVVLWRATANFVRKRRQPPPPDE